jgi:hypothetical protein
VNAPAAITAEDAGDRDAAVGDGDQRRNGGEGDSHDHRQADADARQADALDQRGNAAGEEVGIDQECDLVPRQSQRPAHDQRHRDRTGVHRQHMLQADGGHLRDRRHLVDRVNAGFGCHGSSILAIREHRLEAQARDAGDLLQRLPELKLALTSEARREARDDRAAVEVVDRNDERKPELALVGAVERLQAGELLRGAMRKLCARLLAKGSGSELAADCGLAGEFRVRADEGELRFLRCVGHCLHHRCMQRSDRGKRTLRPDGGGYPRRVLEHAVQRRDEGAAIESIDFGERHAPAGYGCVAIQCRAISTRRAIQTPS